MKNFLTAICLGISGLTMSQYVVETETYTGHPSPFSSSGTGMSLSLGKMTWSNCTGAASNRMYKELDAPTTNRWRIQFEFRYTSTGSHGPIGHLAALTDSTNDPTSDPVGGTYPVSNNSTITTRFLSSNKTNNESTFVVQGGAKLNAGTWSWSSGIHLASNTDYTIVLERNSDDEGAVTVYEGAVSEANLLGSACFSVPSTMGSLNVLQHGNVSWAGPERAMSAILDNTIITHYPNCSSSFAATNFDKDVLSESEITNSESSMVNSKSQISKNQSIIKVDNLGLNSSVEIFNLDGKKVYSTQSSDAWLMIDMSNYAKGVYMVKVINKGSITSEKIMLD